MATAYEQGLHMDTRVSMPFATTIITLCSRMSWMMFPRNTESCGGYAGCIGYADICTAWPKPAEVCAHSIPSGFKVEALEPYGHNGIRRVEPMDLISIGASSVMGDRNRREEAMEQAQAEGVKVKRVTSPMPSVS